jgi:hypothetical protein
LSADAVGFHGKTAVEQIRLAVIVNGAAGSDDPHPALVFFFEFFFERRTDAGRRTEGLAIIVERQPGDVRGQGARRGLHVDDDRHRTAFDAVTE